MGERIVSAITLLLVLIALSGVVFPDQAQSVVLAVLPGGDRPDIDSAGNAAPSRDELAKYLNLLSINKRLREAAFDSLEKEPQPTDAAIILDVLVMTQHPDHKARLFSLLRKQTGQDLPAESNAWYGWLWQARPGVHPGLRELKHRLYSEADPSFKNYFGRDSTALVPFDEIRLADYEPQHVRLLHKPEWTTADQAGYLADSDMVSGLEWPGETRALPWRVLQYFHLTEDNVGDENYICVRDDSSGKPVVLKSACRGVAYNFTPSGLLHRSTMLLSDDATKSLWSAATGQPVFGPLAGKGLQLEKLPVIQTTWSKWRKQKPQTKVLANVSFSDHH